MALKRAFNKIGSIDIEKNTMKYRIPLKELSLEDPESLEKEIKRKLKEVPDNNIFLLPYSIDTVNQYMLLFYDLTNFSSIDSLQQMDLKEKIPYFQSMVNLGKVEQDDGLKLLWDPHNFVVDTYEKNIKVILFETESLKIYEDEVNTLKAIKEAIIKSMTNLKVVLSMPKRHNFIQPNAQNYQFVENVYGIESLDDLAIYLESVSLDIEQASASLNQNDEEMSVDTSTKQKKKKPKKSKAKRKQRRPPKIKENRPGKKKVKKVNKEVILAGIVAGIAIVLFGLSNALEGTSEGNEDKVVEEVQSTSEFFNGSQTDPSTLVQAYRKAYDNRYSEAYTLLESIPKKEFSDQDIPLLLKVYDKTENMSELIDVVPSLATEAITYYIANDSLNQIKDLNEKMETENPYIIFETAMLEQEYELALSVKDQIDLNGRKESQIVEAYLNLQKGEDARDFAEKVGNPDLIKRVEEYIN